MINQGITVLAGDIGGTKTNLAIFTSEAGLDEPMASATFSSGEYSGLEPLVTEFLSRCGRGINITYASFAVAGPVKDGRAKITNLPWVIDKEALAGEFGFSSIQLINDLMACACAVTSLNANDLHVLNEGISEKEGARVIVAPGTGLGEAYLVWDGTRYCAYPSEGGHADFAPATALDVDLLNYLQKCFDHVSYERVCSGVGLPNIYHFLKDSGYAREPEWLAEKLAVVSDPVPVIIDAALDGKRDCLLCRTVLQMFISILGAEAGNMALKVMASGGVYLGGGLPPRIISMLENGLFMESFRCKGRMAGLMEKIPVYVIMNPKAALLGAARFGIDHLLQKYHS